MPCWATDFVTPDEDRRCVDHPTDYRAHPSHLTARRTHELHDLLARPSGSERIGDGIIGTVSGNGCVAIGGNNHRVVTNLFDQSNGRPGDTKATLLMEQSQMRACSRGYSSQNLRWALQDEATYEQLTSIVREAAERNESIGEVVDRLRVIGEVGSRLAEKVAGLRPADLLRLLASEGES